MTRLLQILRATLLLVLTAGAALLFWYAVTVVRDVHATLTLVNTSLAGQHANGDDGLLGLARFTLQNSAAAANAVKQTAQDANRIARQQEPLTRALTAQSVTLLKQSTVDVQKLGAAVDALNGTLAALDGTVAAVNADTLPRLNAAVDDADVLVKGLTVDSHGTFTRANALLADPAWLDTASNLAMSSRELTGTMMNLNTSTGYIKNMLAPKRPGPFFETLAVGIADHVLPGVAGAVVSHFLPLSVSGNIQTTITPTLPRAPAP